MILVHHRCCRGCCSRHWCFRSRPTRGKVLVGDNPAEGVLVAFVPATGPDDPAARATTLQRKQLDLIQSFNRDLATKLGAPDQLEGVIENYVLGSKMQSKVPELLDISKEPQKVKDVTA